MTKRGKRTRLRAWAALVCLVGLLGAAERQTAVGTRAVLVRIARTVTGAEATTVEAARIGGTRLTSLKVSDLRVRVGSAEIVTIESLELRYRLLSLFRRSLVLERAEASGVHLDLRECATDWLRDGESPPAAANGRAWGVLLEQASIAESGVRGGACREGSNWSVAALEGTIAGVRVGPRLEGGVADLRMEIRPSGAAADYSASLEFAGTLHGGVLSVDSLTIRSPRSELMAEGVLRTLTAPPGTPDIDFSVRADSIAFADLEPFAPYLTPDGSARVDARLTSSSDVLAITGTLDLLGGGTASVAATLTEADSEYLRYGGKVTVAALDGASVVRTAPVGPVDGVVDFDIGGPALDRLSGTATISASIGASSPRARRGLRLQTSWDEGRAEVSGSLGLEGITGSVEGWVRPLDERRTGELGGDFEWRTSDTASITGALAGGYEVALSFEDWRRASGHAELRLDRSSRGDVSIPGAAITLDVEEGRGAWRAEASIDPGRVVARGALDLSAHPRLQIDEADFRDLNLTALMGTRWESALSGTLAATRTGGAFGAGGWTAQVELDRSSVGSIVLNGAAIDLVLEGPRLGADVEAEALAGSMRARIEGDVDSDVRLDMTRGSFAQLDLSAASGAGEGMSALSGTATGSWRSSGPQPSRLTLALEDSRFRRMRLDSATVVFDLRGDSVAIDARFVPPAGEMTLRGSRSSASNGAASNGAAWRLEEASFVGFDVTALRDVGATPARLTGRMAASWRGDTPTTAAGDAHLELELAEIGSWTLEAATVDAMFSDGTSSLVGNVDSEALAGTFTAEVDLPTESTAARGTGRFRGNVVGVSIDSVFAAATYDSVALDVDTLQLWSESVSAGGRTRILQAPTRIADFSLTAALFDAHPLGAWFGLDVDSVSRADIVASGSAVGDSLEVTGRVTGVGLSSGSLSAAAFASSGRAFLDPERGLSRLEGEAWANNLFAGRLPVERAVIEIRPQGGGTMLSAEVLVDDERRFTGSVEARPAGDATEVVVHSLTADLATQEWDLEGTPTLHLDGGVDVRDFALVSRSGTGRISADGVVGQGGTQSLQVRADGIELAGLSDVIGYDDLRGVMGGSLEVSGTAGAPTLEGSLAARGTLRASDPAELTVGVEYAAEALALDASLELAAGRAARLWGSIPAHLTLAPVDSTQRRVTLLSDGSLDLDFTAQQLGLQWLAPWLVSEGVRDVTGVVDAQLHAGGTPAEPVPSGGFEVRQAAASLPVAGIRLREGRLLGRFEDDRVILDHLQVLSGEGSIVADGEMLLDASDQNTLRLHVSLSDFLAVRTDMFRAVTDGDLTIGGDPREPTIAGSLDVLSGDVFLGGRFVGTQAEVVELTADDYATLLDRFGYQPATDSRVTGRGGRVTPRLDLQVRLGRDTWIRQRANPALSVQFTGELRVEKAPNELERVFGRLEAVPRGSYVEQFGRRFAITRGSVDFNGLLAELRLDVAGEFAVPARGDPTASEVVITLGVGGGLNDLGLVLSATPEMENADIVSYLATGRPAGQSMQFGSTGSSQLVERGTTLALGRATSAVERLASESIGLDVMEVRSEGSRGVTVVAGRYVSPRLYLGFKQPIGFRRSESSSGARGRSPEVEIEYQAMRWLLLNLQREGSRIDLFLRSRYAY